MGAIVWWDLLWLMLVVANIGLWAWTDRGSGGALRMLNKAEAMVTRHQAMMAEESRKVGDILARAERLNADTLQVIADHKGGTQ